MKIFKKITKISQKFHKNDTFFDENLASKMSEMSIFEFAIVINNH